LNQWDVSLGAEGDWPSRKRTAALANWGNLAMTLGLRGHTAMHGRGRRQRFLLALLMALFTAAVHMPAVAQTWDGSDSADWNAAANWSGNAVPTTADVSINTTSPNAAVVGLTGPVVATGGRLFVGVTNGATGSLTVQNGSSLTTTIGRFGELAGSTGTGLVTGAGTTWTITGNSALIVGNLGTAGTLTISDGAAVSTTHASGFTYVGRRGAGTLNILSGGSLTSAGTVANVVGLEGLAIGVVNVSGAGSVWDSNGILTLSFNGTGTLNISNGAAVVARSGMTLGENVGSSGTLNLSSGGTLDTTSLAALAGASQANFDGGILRARANNANFITGFTGTELNIASGGLTIDTSGFNVGTSATSALTGVGGLTKGGAGTLDLKAVNTYSGETLIQAGTLALTSSGSISNSSRVVANGIFAISDLTAAGTSIRSLAGTGSVFLGAKNLTLTAANDEFSGVISGSGSFNLSGGTQTLSGASNYTGATNVLGGTLLINGNQSGATGLTSVASGATLGGIGTIGGSVTVADGGILSPGSPGSSPGALSIAQNLTLSGGSILNYQFGAANAPGDPLNDVINVGGDLTLDGTINVSISPGGSFGPGVYRVFNYSGSLINNTLAIGTIPSTNHFIQTAVAGEVNLVNADGMTLTFWDGDLGPKNNNAVNGGDGIWQNPTGNDNWTNSTGNLNAPWTASAFAIFQATGGNVTVDNNLGQVTASGMQFAVDGYHLSGGAIELTGSPTSIIRVGDGTLAGAGYTATIDNVLFGTTQLVKTDLGTLVLNGINTYTGGTAIEGGAVQISSDANLGDASGALTLDGGTLWTTADITSARNVSLPSTGGFFTNAGTTLTLTGVLSGAGGYVKDGSGTLVLTGENSYTGLTTISAGILQIGDGGATGSIVGDVLNNSALAFNRSGSWTYGGAISGTGSVWQIGSGVTILTGTNTYTGPTHVGAGTLRAGATTTFSAASDHIVYGGGTLDLAGFDQAVASLDNAGTVNLGGAPGTTLTVAGNYIGSGGVFNLNTTLNDDASPTDRVVVGGDTSGSSWLRVTNVGGAGAATVEGIKVVDVVGASNGAFSLLGDYVFHGQQAVVGGAYAYTLQQNGVSTPTDGDWYLRSSLINPPPDTPSGPLFQPGVPLYEAYPQILLNLISMPTLRDRVGHRYLARGGAGTVSRAAYSDDDVSFLGGPSSGAYTAPTTSDSGQAWWGRVDASHISVKPSASTAGASFDADQVRLQTGFDAKLYEDGSGKLMGGLSVQHGTSWAKVNSFWGDGKIDIEGYGVGATMTWYGLRGLYVDGQAQVHWFDTDMRSSLAGSLTDGDNAVGYGLSLETGKRFAAGGPWALTPQVQLAYTRADFDFTDTFGAAVAARNGDSLLGRLGLALDYRDAWTGGRGPTHSHLYGIANLYYEFLDGTSVDVAGTKFINERDELWGGLGVGGTYSWNAETYALFGEVSVNTSLENLGDSYSVNGTGGFRVRW
jgi:fibronectin-binding autotransporter adhesin